MVKLDSYGTPKPMTYSLSILSMITCIILVASLIHSHHSHKATHYQTETKLSVLSMTYLAIFSYILMDISQIAENSFSLDTWGRIVCRLLKICFWCLAQLFLYNLLILRLHYSFNGTKYAISKKVYIIYVLLIFSFLFLSLASLIGYSIGIVHDDQIELDATHGAFQIGLEVTDLSMSVFLIILFVNKMIHVTVDLHAYQSDIFIDDQVSRFNENQKILLNITAKYFVLSSIATVWTQMASLVMLIAWICEVFGSEDAYDAVDVLVNVTLFLDGIANPICLFLIFEVNDKWYRRGCSGCHAFARLCFRRCTQRKVRKKYSTFDNDLQLNLLQ